MLGWAASGGMALTGFPGDGPSLAPAGLYGLLVQAVRRLADATGVRADPAELIAGRAGLTGFGRAGRVSAGGSSRLLRCADGWCAVTLSRPSDLSAVPAVLGMLGGAAGPGGTGSEGAGSEGAGAGTWEALESRAASVTAAELAAAAQLLGVPAAPLPPAPPTAFPADPAVSAGPAGSGRLPGLRTRLAAARPGARLDGALVVDLSSMWAGPLCARLLGLAGARVVKVEAPDRPDGSRAGNRDFYDWLHSGHASVALDFRGQRDTLRALLEAADVVIEASRPRALAQLGLAPGDLRHRPGQVRLSITGYGRASDGVAFGDDAAVAGGLAGRDAHGDPVFCADAIADPLTGLCGALLVGDSLSAGGGELIDLAMRDVAAAFAAAPGPGHGPHEARPDGTVRCPASGQVQEVLPPRPPVLPGQPAAGLGADTETVLAGLAAPGGLTGRGPSC